MTDWSFYDPMTGYFSRRKFCGPDDSIAKNTPPGLCAIRGAFDPLAQRVDCATGEVVDYQPPQPSEDYEWDAMVRRWVLTREAAERLQRRNAALAQIRELEAEQARPQREYALDPQNTEARARLEAIDAQIALLRADL